MELALTAPILFAIVAGIIQFGLFFWSQNTLTQIARDTGRWAATRDCDIDGPVTSTANAIAADSLLLGYPQSPLSVAVSWDTVSGQCPPENNQQVSFVTVQLDYSIPVFFPLVSGDLSTSAEFRMEPRAP